MAQSKAAAAPPQLTDLYRPEALQQANANIWPSYASFDWWRRQHRSALLAADALVEISGRTYLHGPRTLQVAIEQGARQAASRVASEAA